MQCALHNPFTHYPDSIVLHHCALHLNCFRKSILNSRWKKNQATENSYEILFPFECIRNNFYTTLTPTVAALLNQAYKLRNCRASCTWSDSISMHCRVRSRSPRRRACTQQIIALGKPRRPRLVDFIPDPSNVHCVLHGIYRTYKTHARVRKTRERWERTRGLPALARSHYCLALAIHPTSALRELRVGRRRELMLYAAVD
jgi:hypothetical protein